MQLSTLTNQPTMSSRDVADLLESRHDDVKRSIERLALKELIQQPPVAEVKNSQGQTVSVYLLNKRDSYVVVAQLSPAFTAKLVDRWQELEAQQAPKLPTTYIRALEKLLEAEKAKEEMELKLESQKPFADFGTAVSASATQVLIGEWIKAINDGGLKIGRNKAFSWFRENGYLADGNMPMQKYIDQGLFKVMEGLINVPGGQRAIFTTMLTGMGQVYFAGKLKDYMAAGKKPHHLIDQKEGGVIFDVQQLKKYADKEGDILYWAIRRDSNGKLGIGNPPVMKESKSLMFSNNPKLWTTGYREDWDCFDEHVNSKLYEQCYLFPCPEGTKLSHGG